MFECVAAANIKVESLIHGLNKSLFNFLVNVRREDKIKIKIHLIPPHMQGYPSMSTIYTQVQVLFPSSPGSQCNCLNEDNHCGLSAIV